MRWEVPPFADQEDSGRLDVNDVISIIRTERNSGVSVAFAAPFFPEPHPPGVVRVYLAYRMIHGRSFQWCPDRIRDTNGR